jgi:hypothetical protein
MAGDDEVWAELVETFHAPSGDDETTWPAAEDLDDNSEPDEDEQGAGSSMTTTRPAWAGTPSVTHQAGGRSGEAHSESEEVPHEASSGDDDHFVPPTPPPLPRTDLITALAWAGVLGTPVLFLLLVLLGQTVSGLPGLAAAGAFVGGFATLILRLRGHDPHDPDNGAVV